MAISLSSDCVVMEYADRILFFNAKNLEMILTTSQKFHNELDAGDMLILKKYGMLPEACCDYYNLEEVFPVHISKAYLLFGTDCNISCRYCTVQYNARNYTYKGAMTSETLQRSLDFLLQENRGIEHITLYGGEPMLHKERIRQFFEYLETLPKARVPRIDLITNGMFFDTEIAELLKKWDVLVLVSLDGKKEHHDRFRTDVSGNGTYDRVISGIRLYRSMGIRVGISMVLGKHNYRNIREICVELKKKYDIVSIGLTLPHMEPDVALDNDFDEYILNHYDEILDVCQEQGLWFEQGMKRLLSLAEKKPYIYGCPSTPQGCMVRILPDGVVTLCENMGLRGLYQIGNVNDKKTILQDIMSEKQFLQWYGRCTNILEECKACMAYAVCGMGCPYDAYLQNGTIDSVEYRSCAITRQAIDWYLGRIVRLAKMTEPEGLNVLSVRERKRVLVECPWENRSF